ncbi:MAG: 4Fe-4S dicluster domain-containing protein [Phycisphaerales bacterium]|nr:4Fe-4S dicluster domain-containing protein [Phycisphaerales bacterium]
MSVNRRDFMRMAAVGLAGAAPAAEARADADSRISDAWMGMLTDLTLCVGCRKCEWACRDANQLPEPKPIDAYDDKTILEQRRRPDALNLTVVNQYDASAGGGSSAYVKSQCMHCFEPACASACLVGAYRKTAQGPVVYDTSACIGCRYCLVACPFEMPAYTYNSAMQPVVKKCMLCFERIIEGKTPACASICPVEAITFGKRSELLQLARKKIESDPQRYVDHVYGEHEAGGTCWLYIAGRPFEELGFPSNVDTTPYAERTAQFLSTVPFIQTIWPAVLMGAYAFSQRRETLAH